jgi:endonuclease YncB( thermonuclease family)
MATGQTILDIMEALHPELQLQSGEADVTRGLLILNASQDLFESLVVQHPDVLGGAVSSVTTTKDTESTAYPTGLLRLDGLDFIDSSTSRPIWPLITLRRRGGHRYRQTWLLNLSSSSNTTGKPRAYWTNGTNIYWEPEPNGTHTIRTYGFAAASDITAAGTFAYPDIVMLPLAILAVKILRLGLDDPTQDYTNLANKTLNPAIDALSSFNRSGARGMMYDYVHSE